VLCRGVADRRRHERVGANAEAEIFQKVAYFEHGPRLARHRFESEVDAAMFGVPATRDERVHARTVEERHVRQVDGEPSHRKVKCRIHLAPQHGRRGEIHLSASNDHCAVSDLQHVAAKCDRLVGVTMRRRGLVLGDHSHVLPPGPGEGGGSLCNRRFILPALGSGFKGRPLPSSALRGGPAGKGVGTHPSRAILWVMVTAPRADVPRQIVAAVRAPCLRLPEAYEEAAWVGTRWRIRKKTFAHVVKIDEGWPPAYARAAGADGPLVVLTFRSSGPELDALCDVGHPFFKPVWWTDIVGMVIDDDVDWDEVAELLTESYCALAPSKLVALVDRPG